MKVTSTTHIQEEMAGVILDNLAELNITQAASARKCGLYHGTVYSLLSGKVGGDLRSWEIMLDALDLEVMVRQREGESLVRRHEVQRLTSPRKLGRVL